MSNTTMATSDQEAPAGAGDGRRLIAEAERLLPLLRNHAPSMEGERRLTPEVHRAFVDAGFYRMTLPPAVSGLSGTLAEGMRVLETLAKGDTSAAWNVWANLGVPAMSAFMDADGVAEVFTDPGASAVGSVAGMGRAVAVEGGYRVTGRWSFLSGIHQATFSGGTCFAFDGDVQRMAPNGEPVVIIPLSPIADCEVIDVWDTTGLRGTGSDDMALQDAFVPNHRVIDFTRPPREGLGPIQSLHVDTAANVTVASMAVGAATVAIEHFRDLVAGRRSPDGATPDSPLAALVLAGAETRLAQARGHLYETVEAMWEFVADGTYNPEAWFAPTALASVSVMDTAIDIVLALYRESGTRAIFRSGVLDRCLRDLVTMGAHKTVKHDNLLLYGTASVPAAT